jgi:glucose/arabinose dehydrogenase
MTATRIRNSHAHSRPFIAPLMAFSNALVLFVLFGSALVLLLGGCQTQDGLSGGDRKNTLAVAFATPPPKFADVVHASGYSTPMTMEFAPDERLFVLEKGGNVKIVGVTAPFLTLNVNQATERGLLGIAFDPNWATQKYVYIHYSVQANPVYNRVSRFTISATDPNKADPASEVALFNLDPLTATEFHNGGALHFGIDGKLYVTTGDNRDQTSPQDKNRLLGKILRFEKTYSGTPGMPNIPATGNPFCNTQGNKACAVWGLGLRNPFTFAVQPGTGRIFITDVGEDGYEEINDATLPGLNFGWPLSEGPTTDPRFTGPIGGYVNGTGVNLADCAIIGGAFYNPAPGKQKFPDSYLGDFFYGDYCSQTIKSIDLSAPGTPTGFATNLGANLMDIKFGPDGNLYYLTINGSIGKITYTGLDVPTIAKHPLSQTISVNQPVTFTVEANGVALTYKWQKNNADLAGATGTSYTLPSVALGDNGATYRAVVTGSTGTVTSNAATLTVINNQLPVPTITAPAATLKFNGGQTITFSATATDAEDGPLGASAFFWKVDLVHDTHTHDVTTFPGTMGSTFVIPQVGETAPTVAYRFTLTVTDSKGSTATVVREIQPNTVTVNFATNPPGLVLTVDGQPKTTPFSFVGVVGIKRSLSAVSPQTLNGTNYTFTSWSDAGAAQHELTTPATNNTTLTATFGSVGGSISLPGRIEAENYKNGGSGTGYNDLTPTNNQGGQYRPLDGVDIEATTDVGGGYNVGWTQAAEWLQYDINVATAGTYTLTMRMASGVAGTKTAAVTVDGAAKGAFNLTDARGWQVWNDVVVTGVSLPVGQHVLRIAMNTGDFNLNYLHASLTGSQNVPPTANAGLDKSAAVNTLVTLNGSGSDPDGGPQALTYAWTKFSGPAATLANANTTQPSFTPATAGTYVFRLAVFDGAATVTDDIQVTVTGGITYINLPGRIEAENFQPGGQGVGYNDLTPANNQGGQYKPAEGVDIEVTGDVGGGYNVGWTDPGEWLEYDVNVATAGTYTLTARIASGAAGTKSLVFKVDNGADIPFSFSDATGWQSWKNVVVTGVNLTAGTHVVRLTLPNGAMNVNYVDVTAGTPPANLLLNGDFANGIVSWNTYFAAPATGTIANEAGAARITITSAGANEYEIQLWQGVALTAGKSYTLDFDIKAEATPKNFKVVFEHNGTPWTKYVDQAMTVTAAANTYQHVTYTWTQSVADAGGRLVLDFGAQNLNDLWVDNVVLK